MGGEEEEGVVQWGLCPRALERMQLESLPELSFFSLDALKHSVTPWQEWRVGEEGPGGERGSCLQDSFYFLE